MMNRLTRDDVNIHFEPPPGAFEWEYVAVDTEWWGQTLEKLHRPHGRFACLGCTSNGRDVYMIFKPEEIQEFMDRIQNATMVGHNLQYDIRQLRKYATIPDRENIWDSMLCEQVRFSGLYDKFRLAACARRYLDLYMDKDVREEFSEDNGQEMDDDQIFYAACDIVTTWHVGKAQMDAIDEDDKSIWEHVEMPFLWVLLASGGTYFDGQAWSERVEREKLDHEQKMAAMTINPNSSAQVKQFFLEKYKVKLESTDEKHLLALINKKPKTAEDVRLILDARGGTKSGSTYGMKWVEAIEEDGRIYPSAKQIGTVSGRMSFEGLAIQTIPHEKEYRSCFMAAPGNTLVIKDYSAQEPRILACITHDKKLINIFNSGKDIYISIGFEIFGEVFDKKDKRRQDMKSIILGVSYGMTFGLAAKLGVSQEEADELLSTFFKKFPGVAKWYDGCQAWKDYTVSILGRKYWNNPYKNGWERNNLNHPMQSCLRGDTQIFVDGIGLVSIKDAYEKCGTERIKMWDGNEMVGASLVYTGKKEECKITTMNNSIIWSSPDHKYKTHNSYGSTTWKNTDEITKFSYIERGNLVPGWEYGAAFPYANWESVSHNANNKGLELLDNDSLGFVIGRLASDGYVRPNKSIQFIVAEHEKEIISIIEKTFSGISNISTYEDKPHENSTQWVRVLTINNTKISKQVSSDGDIKTHVPAYIKSSKTRLRAYLRGMFDGDGSVSNDGVVLNLGKERKESLVADIQFCLQLFGIQTTTHSYGNRVILRVLKRHLKKFNDEIGLTSFDKKHKLLHVSKVRVDKDYGKIYGNSIKVRSVEHTGKSVDMYDVVNSDTGQFMANGLITHNSAADTTKIAAAMMYQRLGYSPCKIFMHDELVCEFTPDQLEEGEKVMNECMLEAQDFVQDGIIPPMLETFQGRDWSSK